MRRVAICGGGVAAVEALLGLRALLGLATHIDVIAPNRRFLYEPLAVAEPFDLASTRLFDLADIVGDHGAQLHVASLEAVDPDRGRIILTGGTRLVYDQLIVAVGARRRAWLPGALHFTGAGSVESFRAVLGRLERGELFKLAFTPPAGATWTLPTYELALLTASWVAERHLTDIEITVITPEHDPLTTFGPATSRAMRGVLGDRGIRLLCGESGVSVTTAADGSERSSAGLELASGSVLDVEQVVAMPRLEGPSLPGLPADESGFIPIDEYARVIGLRNVYAVGDATTFEIKQGGIATQQADAAVESIAASLGAGVVPAPFQRVLRGVLLTGVAPTYLRAALSENVGERGDVAADPLWWPPTKIAGRYLGPYLAEAAERADQDQDEAAAGGEEESRGTPMRREASHREARELALSFALADAGSEDYRSALRWLDVVEQLDGSLPAGYPERREQWRALVKG